ncbi:MAG TPA: NHL repeat-containing protein, partial [bacterium]|nr:NHL repeat-containing protein [bacterium]
HIWTGVDTNGVEQPAGLYKAKLMQRQQLIEGLRIESNQSMSNPQDLAVDIYGNVYVADYGKHSIKKFSKNGTFLWSKGKIGSGGVVGGDPEFYKPRGITVDKNGNIYVADQGNNRIQKLDANGNVVNTAFLNISANGFIAAQHYLRGLDSNDTYIYVIWDDDKNATGNRIWVQEYILSTGALNASYLTNSAQGNTDATGYEVAADIVVSRFRKTAAPYFVLVANPDETIKKILAISSAGGVTTVQNNIARFQGLTIGTTFADSMIVFAIASDTNKIYKYRWNDNTTLTYIEIFGDTEWSSDFELNGPCGIALDSINRNLWVADSKNNRLVCFDADNGSLKFTIESEAKSLSMPKDVAVDNYGYLYVADYGNNRIHKFDVNGIEQSGWPKGRYGNGITVGAEPEFKGPYGLAIDKNGYIYIGDAGNGRIIKCDSNGLVIDATWGNNFSINAAQYTLRGFTVTDTHLYVMYDDDLITTSSERVWFLRINLNSEVNQNIFTNQDWGKNNVATPAQGEPVVCDMVVESKSNFAYISNPDMTDNTVNNSNSIKKVNASTGATSFFIDSVMEYTGIAIDEFDVLYTTNSDGTGGNIGQYKIWRYFDNNPLGLTTNAYQLLGASASGNGYMPFGNGYGSGYGKMGRAEHIVYDKINRCIWVSDMENNCIIRFDIVYDNDSSQQNQELIMVIEDPGAAPNVLNFALYGSNINYFSDENKYYCRVGNNDTLVISFNKTMDTSILPNITIVFADNYETTVIYDSYFMNTYIGIFNIPEGHDGEAFIRITGAKDTLGTGFTTEPFESQKFIIDTMRPAAPALNISSPYNVTTNPVSPYITGSVDDEYPYLVNVYTFSNSSGTALEYTQSNIRINSDKTFSAAQVYLKTPAPTTNYIGAVAIDKAGNRSDTTTPLKIINYVSGAPGNINITPAPTTGIKLNTKNSFYIKYTAAENITEPCTITIFVPYGWSNPQNILATSAGFVRLSSDSQGATNLRILNTSVSDTFFQIVFDAMTDGGYLTAIYGDTQNNANPNAATLISNDAYLGQNNFTVIRKKHSASSENIQANSILVIGEPLRCAFQNTITDTNLYKGQKDIELATLTFYNDNQTKSTKISNLKFAILNNADAGIIPSSAISKITIKDNTTNYAIKTNIENSGSVINIALTENLIISPQSSKTINILVDISANATAAGFKISIADSTYIKAFDTEVGVENEVVATSGQSFNLMKSAYCVINPVNPATDLYIDFANYSPAKISLGQTLTRLANLTLVNPIAGSSNIKLKTLKLSITDTNANPINFNQIIDRIIIRQTGTAINYANITTMPTSDSVVITLTDLFIGYNDTKQIDILFTFKSSSAINSIKLVISDSSFFSAVDANLNASCTVSINPNSSNAFPLRTTGAILQSPNVLQKIQTSFNTSSIFTGGEFQVNIYTRLYFDSAFIYAIPSTSDLKFYINNIDSTSEFQILSTSGSQVIDTATAGNTIAYYCKHNGLSAGALRIDLAPNKFLVYDHNDYFYGGQTLTISDSRTYFDTTAALTILSDSIEIQLINLSNTVIYPDSKNILVNQFRVINNQTSADTLVNLALSNIYNNNYANTIYIYLDNENNTFDAGDTLLFSDNFQANTITATINSVISATSSNLYFVVIDIAQSVIDKSKIDIEIPINSMYFSSGIIKNATSVNSSGELTIEVIAQKLAISPAVYTFKATDNFGNTDKDFNNIITITISDLYAPNAIISSATPGIWDTGDTQASGYLSNGEAIIQIYDAANIDTVSVQPSSIYLVTNDTAVVYFTNNASITANIVNATAAAAGETNILILDFIISSPSTSDTINKIIITSNNTSNSDIKFVKLWQDSGAIGFQGAEADTLIGISNFAADTVSFDTPIIINDSGRFFITYDLNNSVEDNNILDAYLNLNAVNLEIAGLLPLNNTVNSPGNSTISVIATKLKLSKSVSYSNIGDTLILTVSATDTYDNIDKNYNTNLITITNNGSAKYVSATLTSASGIPNGPLTGYLTNGLAQITAQNQYSETITFTASSSGLTNATITHSWTDNMAIDVFINLTNNIDTYIQIITLTGTTANALNGETVSIFVNNVLQSVNQINSNTWAGTAQLSGLGDTIVVKAEKGNGNTAFDTRIINYYGPISAKIILPDTYLYDTYIQNIIISGTTQNTNSGDSVLIFVNNIFNSIFIITSQNGNFSGTAQLSGIADSVTIKLIDKFNRSYFDTITVNYYFPNALNCQIFIEGRVNHSCSFTLFSNTDTYTKLSDVNGNAAFSNIIPNTYSLTIYLPAYKTINISNIYIDTTAVINLPQQQLLGGDLNQSGAITFEDLGILLYYFGKQVDSPFKGDINNSGWVTEDDYSIL